jgi:hypothetical protein
MPDKQNRQVLPRHSPKMQCMVVGKGWPEPYIHTVYDRMTSDFPAKNNVYTPYIYKYINIFTYIWFWPTLLLAL